MSKILTFEYWGGIQRSPEWFALKRGKIGTSELSKWLAVSKAKATAGKPLKARLDYEKQLMFERQFNTNFEKFTTEAMRDGVDLEDFARKQYQEITGRRVEECGAYYNDFIVSSPDRHVDDDGLLEIKILRDTNFTEVLATGKPFANGNTDHNVQIQGQLWASAGHGRKWCDYVAVNLNSKKVVIIRVEPDTEFHEYLNEAVQEQLVTEPFKLDNVHDIIGEVPQGLVFEEARIERRENNLIGGW